MQFSGRDAQEAWRGFMVPSYHAPVCPGRTLAAPGGALDKTKLWDYSPNLERIQRGEETRDQEVQRSAIRRRLSKDTFRWPRSISLI